MIFSDVTASVGRTPMVELGRIAKGSRCRVVAKLEMRNPCGSVKDRVGVALIEDALACRTTGLFSRQGPT
jgi:cysteine synthase A